MKQKNYVITKEIETKKIVSIHKYDNEKISIQKIKDKISEAKETDSTNHYILIENPETIEILNHVFRFYERLESAMSDIEDIARRFN